jgi:hypothetical protein
MEYIPNVGRGDTASGFATLTFQPVLSRIERASRASRESRFGETLLRLDRNSLYGIASEDGEDIVSFHL